MNAFELIKENEWALLAIGYYSPKKTAEGILFRINRCLHDGWVLVTDKGEIQLLSTDGTTILKKNVVKNSVLETLLEMVNKSSFPLDKISVM